VIFYVDFSCWNYFGIRSCWPVWGVLMLGDCSLLFPVGSVLEICFRLFLMNGYWNVIWRLFLNFGH
jgi:hypothetical protein